MPATQSTVTPLRLAVAAPAPQPASGTSVRRSIFISYAHEDVAWLKRFKEKLAPVLSDCLNVWSDQDIATGQDWHSQV